MKTITNKLVSHIKKSLLGLLLCSCSAMLFFTSCTDNKNKIENNLYSKLLNSANEKNTHRWFYFTQTGFLETYKPSLAPTSSQLPWTEKPRITSGIVVNNSGFFTVNKLGILVCPMDSGIQKNGIGSQTYLAKMPDWFSHASVGSLYYIDNTITCNFYTNTIFDSSIKETICPILVQFDNTTNQFQSLLYSQNFYPKNNELYFKDLSLNELHYIDTVWYAGFKSSTEQKTTILFTQTSFNESLLSAIRDNHIHSVQISQELFQSKITPRSFKNAPQKLQKLLKMIPNSTSFYIRHIENTGVITYAQNPSQTNPLEACSLTMPHCSLAVFSDGTAYFAGKLPSKHVINKGKTIAFKLPKLPPGYIYGSTILAGSNLYISWEETDFYQTGTSGFLVVDLEKVLYTGSI
ncbi:MAG TPA: hypothetical protein VFC68_06145 [Treponemataceae bacterium]|nr:hypothetical protein [Treponemataceae bacterium]